jgi:type I restriction enzyme S subunit
MRLDHVFEVQLGKMLSGKARAGNSPKPYMRNKNVQWGVIDTSEMFEMDFTRREMEKFSLRNGDLLMCEGGVPGRTAIWRGEIAECYYQKAIHRLRPLNGRIVPEFFLYWFRYAFDITNAYGVSGASSTIAHLPAAQLRALDIPVPDLDDQRQIAAVLSAVQRAIERQERLIALTAELKNALLHKLFTEGTRGEPRKQTELGLMPESWSIERFDTRYQTQLGKMLSQKAHTGRQARPYLRNKNIQWDRIDLSDLLEMDFDERERKRFELRLGDLLVCEGGEPGRAALWNGASFECYYQKALHRVRPLSSNATNEYLLCWLSYAIAVQNLYGTAGASSTIAHLPVAQLKALPIPFPEPAEQEAISSAIQRVAQVAEIKVKAKISAESLFRTLLHQLMTAQIRVHDLDLSALDEAKQEPVGAA